jgi:hypothetical protein
MSSRRLIVVLIAGTALVGCNTAQTHIGDESAVLGEAVAYDNAIQTINPTPVYPPNAAQPGSNGDVGASAVKRYRTDAVKPVETEGTTSGVTGGGGSGMSGGPH